MLFLFLLLTYLNATEFNQPYVDCWQYFITKNNIYYGYDNITNSIWLAGGYGGTVDIDNHKQLVQFNITSQTFNDYGAFFSQQDRYIYGETQYYCQFNQYLYMIEGSAIYQFNVTSHRLFICTHSDTG